ncbi:MAG: hypothetical protein Q8Q08_05490 [Candidatus Omnitrophota bacterium]|nr:hypothetical protein [Candidatus Omnitrophota bacterium]MDZ4242517.1 hypothetical protein [Candidatus Omnitrophota bacterium]
MTPDAIKQFCRTLAVVCVAVGGVGSVLCLPFALTTDLSLITTAGIYFIAGAVMITGGLLGYVALLKTE